MEKSPRARPFNSPRLGLRKKALSEFCCLEQRLDISGSRVFVAGCLSILFITASW